MFLKNPSKEKSFGIWIKPKTKQDVNSHNDFDGWHYGFYDSETDEYCIFYGNCLKSSEIADWSYELKK